MWRYLFSAVFLAIIATEIPSLMERIANQHGASLDDEYGDEGSSDDKPTVTYATEDTDNPLAGRTTRIKADGRGHFIASARLNGRRLNVMVDTGASFVAINRTTARRIGIELSNSDFKHVANTANGQTKMAVAMIDEVQIGRVYVKNVRAGVLDDNALDGILLGMSFLNELKRFEVSQGTLVLTQ